MTHNNVITLDGNKIKRVWLGGSAVVPSLQKAYFFGGLQYVAEVGDWVPVGDMIIRDFAANTYESQSIPWETRQEGTLAHVQVGHHGILLAFGGSIRWGDPIPMSQIAIFDPESNNFTQRYQPAFAANETSADGTGIPLERGPLCAVVATAKDRSSYQVYIFGGYNDRTDTHLNDVWILSLPSFLWFQASRGTQHPDQGGNEQPTPRYGHRCELVGNGQRTMMVYGGTNRDLKLSECESNGVYAYDLSTLTWLPEYDPGVGEYQVPELVYSVIGGG